MTRSNLWNPGRDLDREPELTRSLLESMADGVAAFGADGTLIRFNPRRPGGART